MQLSMMKSDEDSLFGDHRNLLLSNYIATVYAQDDDTEDKDTFHSVKALFVLYDQII